MHRQHGRIEHQKLVLLKVGGEHGVGGAIGGAAVGVDDHRRVLLKVFFETGLRGAHDMGDGTAVVVARDADHDVGAADTFDGAFGRPGQRRRGIQLQARALL